MSTLGGNRGERDKNAKPKFQQLDINNLYRTSRGETSEPTTLKNAVPRKHGMQSLGKVPSARRPPANLPSLKAETSSPATTPTQSSDQQQQQTSNSSSASWADSSVTAGAPASANQTSQLNTSSSSSNQTNTGSSATSSNTSWSAVATGGNVKEENLSQPPLYQSPQFQNEFPSLDGSVTTSTNANAAGQKQQNLNSNSHDIGDQMSLKPSTDAASWMQQQQSNSGSARGAGGENGTQANYQQSDLNVPPKFMALMPSFMLRGAQNAGTNATNSSLSRQQNSNQTPNNNGNYQNQARSGRNQSHYGGSSYNNDYSNNRDSGSSRHRQAPPPRHSARQQQHDDRSSSFEPEIIVQRPIIKEEELERIDSLARDEGWSKHDEIDYNKKIQFSDDEADDIKPKEIMSNDKKFDAWRDGEKKDIMKQNGPVGRTIDPALGERLQKRREEEERMERERKLAAQKKLLELEEKTKNKSSTSTDKEKKDDKLSYGANDYDKKSEQRGSMDFGKKYGDKYDSYDGYGRGAPPNDYKKTSFQSNLPPRFQKQQNFDRHDERRVEKPGPPGYKPLHQQDSKNIPFAQQSYEQRWMYNKQSQQAPPTRRNMSSLSQSSSDDNRRDNNKGYARRRQESEEDDYRYAKDPVGNKQKPVQAQITRSMSDSSDKLSDHNRSEKSTSREYLGTSVCWAEVCENDKRTVDTKSRRVSESSAMSDDQPRTILQRNKPLHDQLHNIDLKKEIKESQEGEKKSVLSDSLTKSELVDDKKPQDKVSESSQITVDQSKKSLESIPEKDQNPADKPDATAKDSTKNLTVKESDDNRHVKDKKTSPRSNHYERDSRSGPPTRGNYSYRGGNNWQGRRGGSHPRGGRYDYSDSENSDDYDQDWNRNGQKGSMGRKDLNRDGRPSYNSGGPKEGFSPRGEPSRRGRGSAVSAGSQSSGFRRSGSNGTIIAPIKNRVENYGPPSSKSPFGSNDEKSSSEKRDNAKEKSSDDDRTKQKQKALSEGLMNKSQKESNNVATKISCPAPTTISDETAKQHSTEPTPIGEQKDKKAIDGGDDKSSNDGKNMMGQRTTSSSSFNSNQSRQKSDRTTPTNVLSTGKPGTKPPQQQNNSVGGGKPISAPSSNQYPSSMPKTTDTRHQMNRNDPRMDPRNSSSRSAPRFTKQRDNTTGPSGPGQSGNMNRMTGSYWDKNHPSDQMHCVGDDKMSMMQMSGPQSGIHSTQTNNLLNAKTDVMKQQNQQQASSMQQQQQQQQNQNQSMLDGTSLKTTLIFENTSYKSGPPAGIKRPQGPPPMGQQKPQENTINTINDMIDQQAKEQSLSSALQNLSFGQKTQNDMVDMNFSYPFDSQIGLLTDDRGSKSGFGVVSSGSNTNVHQSQGVSKTSSLGLVGAKTGMQSSNILNTDALNMKVASCKKVWEEPSVSMEHGGSGGNDDVISNFVAQQQHLHQYGHSNMNSHHSGPQSYGGYGSSSANDHNSLEHFNKSNEGDDGSSYPSPGQQHMSNMVHSQNQQASMNMKAAEAFGSTANVCKVKPTQQQMHQAGLSPPPQMQQNQLQQQQHQTYYSTPNYQNMSTIPSPPAVVYNTQSATGGLYNPYNLDAARPQLYSYPTGGTVGANNSMSFNAFMQTPNLTSAPTHEMYQNLSQYRAAVQPFNQTPQLNNPNAAVLISSATASNSMMSSKSNSQIGAIGSKSSQSAGPAAASGQYGQQYMNHLYHQHQNSYYTNSTGQQANPYYNGPTGTGGAATGNYAMFSSHGSNVSNGPPQPQQMPNFGSVGSPFPLGSQIMNNLVINQQYRSGPVVNTGNNGNGNASSSNAPPGYMKQQHQSQLQDPKLTSPSMNDVNLSQKVYNNQNWDSSTSSSNYGANRMYGSAQNSGGNVQSQNQRWQAPGPIQRPTNNSNGINSGSASSPYAAGYQQNYQNSSHNYQQRNARNSTNSSMNNNSGMSTMSQGKSQYFNQPPSSTKLKAEGEKKQSQNPSSTPKIPDDSNSKA